MSKSSNELIQRYLAGIATDDEVRELEARLLADDQLQDEFLFQSEVDAHLRQEAQSITKPDVAVDSPCPSTPPTLWKWISGVSTVAATILMAIVLLNTPPHREAIAHPSLGNLTVDIPQSGQNIWAAAAKGDLEVIRSELKEPGIFDVQAECGLTPLHIATLAYRPAAVELLLAHGADVSIPDREGNTALHMASFLGRTDIVLPLLRAGADPELRNHLGFSSLDNLAITWSPGLEDYYHYVERVLNTKLDIEKIRAERPKILRLLASENTTPPDVAPPVSIWQAAMTGNTAVVDQHIRAGTDLNAKEDFGGSTPLILAAIFGQKEVAATLIDAGANLDAKNNGGGTALHQACFFCRPEIVELLLQSGANSNATNDDDRTPLNTVTVELDAELIAIYKNVYDWLHLDFGLDDIKAARIQIAKILNEHEQEGSDE